MAQELTDTGNSKREPELVSLSFDYVGEEIVRDFLLPSAVIAELTDSDISSEPPEEKTEFTLTDLTANINTATDMRPGQTARIGQKGYRLVIYRYSFNGSQGGHSSNHVSGYTNNLPREWRAGDGEYRTLTIGPACGVTSESVTVYTYDGQSGSAQGQLRVIISGLQQLGNSPDYVLIGHTDRHPSNHWVTSRASSSLKAIAREYRQETGDRLFYNDSSLQWGGLFDIAGQWKPPHYEHRDGNKIDIAATPHTMQHEDVFVRILRRYTTNYKLEGTSASRHYHVRF